jgi:hypothetical protein
MPWKVLKRDCKQADGKAGGYVVVKEKSGGSTEQSSCHTSKEKAQGSIASRNMSETIIMKITKRQLKRIIRETMELDLEVGDVILTGKFKNKRKIVKDFGKDDLGQPTINGTKALNFRIEKLMPKDKWSKKSKEALEFADKVEETKMRITRRQLRRIIKEELLREQQELIPFISDPDSGWENKLANYAHVGDVQAALADDDINTPDLDLYIDDFKGPMRWIEHPDWNKQKALNFLRDLESAWYDEQSKKDKQALASSPNKTELEAIGGNLHMILDKDLPYLTYQPRRKGGKIVAIMIEDDEGPEGFPMGNSTTTMDEKWAKQYGTTLDKVMAVLDQAGATHRKKRKPIKHTPPMYD